MLISCPFCGSRASEEFTVLGDATPRRPETPEADPEAWYDYIYLRNNPRGRHREFWQHVGGCRAWLVVERDTATHEIHTVELARDVARKRDGS
ncbi:sarcosine oxidase subunit delta [Algihabitans albus]|uniref:sarcosine oxidase subunit delta n=1 Tax=Algihabitans albus TaxID=2164067 RepID=UPI000E5CDDD6|nr:sarcosine oxidase subunit delta [Algihabitans albus]